MTIKFLADPARIVDHSPVSTVRQTAFRFTAGVLIFLLGWQLGVLREQGAKRLTILSGSGGSGLIEPGESASGVTVRNPRRDVDISLVWDVWDALTDHYIESEKLYVSPLVYGAAEGLTRAVGDPYTVFMTPQENDDFRDGLKGNLEGIGAELTLEDGIVIIVTPLKGSPAERAGLRARDIIQNVDAQSVEGLNLSQVVDRIRGPKGTTVKLTILRDAGGKAETLDVTITREEIHVPSVESKIIESGGKRLGYVALNQFGESSILELRKELEAFKNGKVHGAILDLRNNGGGYLDGAAELVSLFVREGIVVSVERRQGSSDVQRVNGKVLFPDLPLVVLQNEATASASEIVTGALQDHGRAVIVGQKSFGKGTVQEVVDLPGGTSLRVTVARWLTPKGKNLGKEGVIPDIVIEMPTDPPQKFGEPSKDAQLDAAVEVLTGKRKVPAAAGL